MWRAGSATNNEVMDAEAELLLTKVELINAYLDRRVSQVRLEYLSGVAID